MDFSCRNFLVSILTGLKEPLWKLVSQLNEWECFVLFIFPFSPFFLKEKYNNNNKSTSNKVYKQTVVFPLTTTFRARTNLRRKRKWIYVWVSESRLSVHTWIVFLFYTGARSLFFFFKLRIVKRDQIRRKFPSFNYYVYIPFSFFFFFLFK